MAAEITQITDSNHEHIYCDLHEALQILRRIDSLLTEFQPLMAQFRSPAAAMLAGRKARRNGASPSQS